MSSKIWQAFIAGSYIDPAADKLFVASLTLALTVKGVLPVWLAGCILGRDGALIAAGMSTHHACHVMYHIVFWCSPRHPPPNVPVLATSSTT